VTGIALEQSVSKSPITMIVGKEIIDNGITSTWNSDVNPLFSVKDRAATTLGTSKDSPAVLFARKTFSDHTSWFMSLPSGDPNLWRFIFQNTEAHIYELNGDVVYSGGGMLTIHTAQGGARRIFLKNGRFLDLKISPNSTTVLDTQTGRKLMD
jgi:hypothetical protein